MAIKGELPTWGTGLMHPLLDAVATTALETAAP